MTRLNSLHVDLLSSSRRRVLATYQKGPSRLSMASEQLTFDVAFINVIANVLR